MPISNAFSVSPRKAGGARGARCRGFKLFYGQSMNANWTLPHVRRALRWKVRRSTGRWRRHHPPSLRSGRAEEGDRSDPPRDRLRDRLRGKAGRFSSAFDRAKSGTDEGAGYVEQPGAVSAVVPLEATGRHGLRGRPVFTRTARCTKTEIDYQRIFKYAYGSLQPPKCPQPTSPVGCRSIVP